jgi:CRP/FNR family cyclic AMP-dependent transcriptional regulator
LKVKITFPLLELLPDNEKARVLTKLVMQEYAAGEAIYQRGENCTDAFFVFEGKVKVCTFGTTGEMAYFWDKLPGDFFGYYSAITEKPQTVQTTAVENTILGRMSGRDFTDMIVSDKNLSRFMLKYITEILRSETSRVTDLLIMTAPQRVAATILESVTESGSASVNIPARAELASRLGMTRETLARHLSHLSKKGVIEIKKDEIAILDLPKLSEIVGR